MADDFENMDYEVVTKTDYRRKMAAESELRVPKALRSIPELNKAADFENMGYEAVPKTVSRMKMAAESE